MGLRDQAQARIIIYDGGRGWAPSLTDKFSLMQTLLARGFPVTMAGSSTHGKVSASAGETVVVLGQFTETAASPEPGWIWKDVSGLTGAQVADWLQSLTAEKAWWSSGAWKPWFPVIDYDRCTNCMQCLSFCLFGVYGVDGQQRIQVQNNDQCKTNCPACSRVCPEAAIMFPKYKAGPINGDLVSDSDLQREKMKIDISALLGGDVYQMLRDRSERAKSRFSKERDADKALKERQKCLVKLAQSIEIPPEVLMSLPSPEEIQRRAQEAAARVAAVRPEGANSSSP